MAMKNDYVPGGCNIGAAEIQRRLRAGRAGVAVFSVAFAGLLIGGAEPALHLLLFLPALVGAIGFVQARARFCVYFGFASLFSFSDLGQQARIVDDEARRRDWTMAWRPLARSSFIAAIAALAAFGLASLIG